MPARWWLPFAAASAVVAGLGFWLLLQTMARPAAYDHRLRALEAVRPPASHTGPTTFACARRAANEAETLRRSVAAALGAAGLAVKAVEVGPRIDLDRSSGLKSTPIAFTAEGRHPAEVEGLLRLDRQLPGLYADSLDWSLTATGLSVAFAGRLVCRG